MAAADQMREAFEGLVKEQKQRIADATMLITSSRLEIQKAKREIKRLVNQQARVLGGSSEEAKGVAA